MQEENAIEAGMTETERVEFKRELSSGIDLEEEAVAFLNRREGGILYIGIDNFIRMTVPYITKDREGMSIATVQVTEQVATPTVQVKAQIEANPASSLHATPQVAPQAAPQVRPCVPPQVSEPILRLLKALGRREKGIVQLLLITNIKNRKDFRERYLNPGWLPN